MSQHYHRAQRAFQARFDTERLADRLSEATSDVIDAPLKEFIEQRDMFFIATADEHGSPECSYKGGEPGFVRVLGKHTIAFPIYDGNGMFLTAGNIAVNPRVGMLFIDFETGTRLRLNGRASIDAGDPLIVAFPGAQFIVRVDAEEVFPNCKRYVHRYELVQRSRFVPKEGATPPVPDWKLLERFDGALPADDPARHPQNETEESIPDFGASGSS